MVTREELHAEVWSQPMTKVAERYGVSGSYLTRVCSALNVPRPPQGYWAKLSVGRAPATTSLPVAQPGDQLTWDGKDGPLQRPLSHLTKAKPRRSSRRAALQPEQRLEHSLVRGAKTEFLRSRPVEKWGYLKPFKQLLPDVRCSQTCLDRALDIASKLYKELEAVGGSVALGPIGLPWYGNEIDEREVATKGRQRDYQYGSKWSPRRPTLVYFDSTPIALVVVEMTEEVPLRYVDGGYIRETEFQANAKRYRGQYTFETTKALPSNRLRIVATSAEGVKWTSVWQERDSTSLGGSLSAIAKEIRLAIPEIRELVAQAKRQAEIRRQEWDAAEDRRRRKEDRERIKQSFLESNSRLADVIEHWVRRTAIVSFFDQLSHSIGQLPADEKEAMEDRLKLAKAFVGNTDPLEFFRSWRTPNEIYAPRFTEHPGETVEE